MFQHLMTSEFSPIIEYYPLDFKTDLNGKQQEWEAVVLIPFIDEVHKHTHSETKKMCHNDIIQSYSFRVYSYMFLCSLSRGAY